MYVYMWIFELGFTNNKREKVILIFILKVK